MVMSDLVSGQVPETNVGETFVQIRIQVIICSLHSVPQIAIDLICYELVARN
jgi:hypothetical protein